MTSGQRPATVNVVVATTIMLSFISFWRAAAIVLSDMASSAYYVGGIAENAAGKSAPWFRSWKHGMSYRSCVLTPAISKAPTKSTGTL